ncbi:MAG: hypothetical protein ABIO70_32295 [Pseudomonadota bacterium]
MNVFAGAVPFGMGPVGKLASIIEASTDIAWTPCGDPFPLTVFSQASFGTPCWSREPAVLEAFAERHDIGLAVVVLDPDLAEVLERVGVSVVYVDSLPFLWTPEDPLPRAVSAYCAQLCPALPEAAWGPLRTVRNLHWVGAIVPAVLPPPGSHREGVVLNLGGVHSPHGSGFAYLDLVVPAALAALEDRWRGGITITGSADALTHLRSPGGAADALLAQSGARCETLTQRDYLARIARAELLVTSPGLTTILETSALEVPLVVLPPQNLSQYFNAEIARNHLPGCAVVGWVHPTLSPARVEQARSRGEAWAVRYIQEAIAALRLEPSEAEALRDRIAGGVSAVLAEACGPVTARGLLDIVGPRGTAQVLSVITSLAKATGRAP